MILKRPYAFFIKMFKPIHLLLSGLLLYLIYLDNNILTFLNEYMYSSETLAEADIIRSLMNNFLYIIPIVILIFFIILLGVMYKKNKPMVFYFVGIFSFLIILIINIYSVNFLNTLVENIVSIKIIKLIHDLVLINVILESVLLLVLFIRGIGINFKKFDFNSDLSKIEINESDKEEFELNVNIDINEKKRKRKEQIRKLKYLYAENKILINISSFILVIIIIFTATFIVIKKGQVNKEGVYYSANSVNFKVNETLKLNTSYKGNKITDNYLIVVSVNIKSNYNDKLYLNDFSLKIEDIKFKPTDKYNESLIDLGNFYEEESLSVEYTDYLFVFEIPEKYIESEMLFSYNNQGNVVDVLLEPKELVLSEAQKSMNITENLEFENVLSGVNFKINSYSLDYKFLIEYNYCIKENDCIASKEYLKPSINENYDKIILKLDMEYNSESDLDINTFYKLLSKFGTISYKIGDTWYNNSKFEEIKSKKISSSNVYIGINSNILNADSIKIVFNVRGSIYEYILK